MLMSAFFHQKMKVKVKLLLLLLFYGVSAVLARMERNFTLNSTTALSTVTRSESKAALVWQSGSVCRQ